ncbi:MAG: discoidin domain-containing protein [Acidimicrobiales bacterium]
MRYQMQRRRGWHAGAGAAFVTVLAVLAGSLAASTGPASADSTTTTDPSATTVPAAADVAGGGGGLIWVKESSAHLIAERVSSLDAAIKAVQGRSYLGSDATTLVNGINADISGLQALGQTIAGDATVAQAEADRELIFTQFRVYHLVLPVVSDVSQADAIVNDYLPAVQDAITKLEADENSSNQGVLGPIIANMQAQAQLASSATNGLSPELLAFTPAEWNADQGLLNGPQTELRLADRALQTVNNDIRQADRYLRDHDSPPTTSSTNTSTTPAAPDCSASVAGTALSRAGWAASTNALSGGGDAPANALDGNLKTRFSTDKDQAPGLYFEVDMGTAQAFGELEMDVPNSPTDYARGYNVEVSANGSAWTTVASCTGTGTPETVSFPAQTAQYVEVVLTASNSQWWWSIDEFNLYTTTSGPTTSTSTTTTSTTSTTSTTLAPTTTTTSNAGLDRAKAYGARLVSQRIYSLDAAIKTVQGHAFLGSDGTTLVNGMQADLSQLEALGTAIAGDTTVTEVDINIDAVFGLRVYDLVLPVMGDVVQIDRVTNVRIPAVNQDVTALKGDLNAGDQGVLGPLVNDMQTQVQTATSATSGLSGQLLAYTPAQWDANHGLLNNAGTDVRTANRALDVADNDLQRAERYLRTGYSRRHHRR